MIVVEIHDPEDGRLSFEIGPFFSEQEANEWRDKFLADHDFDGDFVEVRDVERKLLNPNDPGDMDVIRDFFEGWGEDE